MPTFKELSLLLILVTLPALLAQGDDNTQGPSIPSDWSYAVASASVVYFFDNGTELGYVNIKPKRIHGRNTCSRISTAADIRRCKPIQLSSRKLEHMAIAEKDLFASTRTFPGSNSSILHWSIGSHSEDQIQPIFSSSVSRIKSLAIHEEHLFWSECDPAFFSTKSSYNGIWSLNTTAATTSWRAVRLEGSKDINMCKIEDMVIDTHRTNVSTNEYGFFWVDRSIRGRPKIKHFILQNTNSQGEIADVPSIKARNPHSLTVAGDYLYWADSPFLMTFTISKVPLNFSQEPKVIFSGVKQRLRSLSVLNTDFDELVWSDFVSGKLWTYSGSTKSLKSIMVGDKPTAVVSKCNISGNCR